MIKALLFDFSKVLLFSKDKTYTGALNDLNNKLSQNPNYRFFDHFELNKELFDFLHTIKVKIPIYMCTSETIQERPEIRKDIEELFTKVYSAMKMGFTKTDREFYKMIARDLNLWPGTILFVDDHPANIQAAQMAGLNTVRYLNNAQIIAKLSKL